MTKEQRKHKVTPEQSRAALAKLRREAKYDAADVFMDKLDPAGVTYRKKVVAELLDSDLEKGVITKEEHATCMARLKNSPGVLGFLMALLLAPWTTLTTA